MRQSRLLNGAINVGKVDSSDAYTFWDVKDGGRKSTCILSLMTGFSSLGLTTIRCGLMAAGISRTSHCGADHFYAWCRQSAHDLRAVVANRRPGSDSVLKLFASSLPPGCMLGRQYAAIDFDKTTEMLLYRLLLGGAKHQ